MQKSEYVLFFDDVGVINDNEARAPQLQKLIAEYTYGFGAKSVLSDLSGTSKITGVIV